MLAQFAKYAEMPSFTALGRKASAFKAEDIRLSFCFLRFVLSSSGPEDLSPGLAKSKASSLSSGGVSRLWEEPTEASG